MFVAKGDEVILTKTEMPHLQAYVGKKWNVDAVMYNIHPASAMLSRNNLQASAYLKNLEVVPPSDSPFTHNEAVQIKQSKNTTFLPAKMHIGKTGHIKSYDSRNGYYFVKLTHGDTAWLPLNCLIPLNFKGDKFYYPFEQVKYKGKNKIINSIRQSKFKWGQILLIEGEWVHASDVEPLD